MRETKSDYFSLSSDYLYGCRSVFAIKSDNSTNDSFIGIPGMVYTHPHAMDGR